MYINYVELWPKILTNTSILKKSVKIILSIYSFCAIDRLITLIATTEGKVDAMSSEPISVIPGDKLAFLINGVQRSWTITAINNRVVKYLDESGQYAQMSIAHLEEIIKNNQGRIEK